MIKAIVAGDSVLWGQGLRREQKFHELAVREIAAIIGVSESDIHIIFVAHSGAVIDEPNLPVRFNATVPFWQEVPHSTPTVLEQIDQALPPSRSQDPSINLVILNGGINDINFRVILDPTASDDKLDQKIRENCYNDMLKLLRKVRGNFPNAVVVVVGYYPILSEASNLIILQLTVSLLMLTVGLPGPLVSIVAAQRVVRRFRYFHRRQLSWLRRAVTEMYSETGLCGPGVLFAHPAFGPRNSIGAPNALLFGPKVPNDLDDVWERFRRNPLTNILAIEPDDPVSRSRKNACEVFCHDLTSRLQCFVAALGHPNSSGARRYADTIKSSVLINRQINLKYPLSKILQRRNELSVHKALAHYGLAEASISIRKFLQHLIVDCIDVTIKTCDEPFSGTDHDIYLRVGYGWEWKLNENIFEGDLFNDFERGVTATYTIDPAEGRPDSRLYLWQLTEISLELKVTADGLVTDPLGAWKPEWIRVALNGQEVFASRINKRLTIIDRLWTAPNYPYLD